MGEGSTVVLFGMALDAIWNTVRLYRDGTLTAEKGMAEVEHALVPIAEAAAKLPALAAKPGTPRSST